MSNKRGVSKNSGPSLARPYVNDQVFEKMYNIETANKKGTIFPELYLIDSIMYNKDLYGNPNDIYYSKRR
ncbi:MAG: spore coat associated protein CotJA [Peptostreptococcaceae bacterium]